MKLSHQEMVRQSTRYALWAVALLAVLGCGNEPVDANRTSVSGSVSYDGKSLPAGTISFESAEKGIATSTSIKDGVYSSDRAPTGSVKVSIDTASIKYGNPAKHVPIPAKYADTATSGLTVDVKPGVNENVNFDLTP